MRNYDSRKRILVTSGAGFLGSHLCDRLLEQGDELLCVDNLFTGTKRNIDHLHDNPGFEFVRHDVTSLHVEVDETYNLACPASPLHDQHDPVQTTKTSVHGAIYMPEIAEVVPNVAYRVLGDGSDRARLAALDRPRGVVPTELEHFSFHNFEARVQALFGQVLAESPQPFGRA